MGTEIQFTEALTFGASAPFIVMGIGQIKKWLYVAFGYDIPSELLPLVALALAFAWGAILVGSDKLNVDMATFVLQGFTVATSAVGIHAAFRTYEPEPEEEGEPMPKRPRVRKPPSMGKVG